jgi:folate-dependent phosphoribosylglycinamide formyltransferase PurN
MGHFVNLHAGLTPGFRGCHGAYWAIAIRRPHLAGVTVHWIDAGIDTGGVVKQTLISFNGQDNFVTYPYLQLAAGLPLLVETVREFFNGTLSESVLPASREAGSRLFYNPTLWSYLSGRLQGMK